MTIHYLDGKTAEGMLLSRNGNTIRVALKDESDALIFTCFNGIWLSEKCEPAVIQFGGQRHMHEEPVFEDWMCPNHVTAQLIDFLFGGTEAGCAVEVQAENGCGRQQIRYEALPYPKPSRLPN